MQKKQNISSKNFEDISFNKFEKNQNMLIETRERPKSISMWIMLSLQHLFAMFGATVLTPILINQIANATIITTDVALFSSGVGTLIYILFTKGKVPIYLGSSFAFIAAIGSMYKIYGTSVFFGLLGAGVIYIIVAFLIYFFGVKWIKKLLSPIIVAPMIMIIGLSVASTAINSIGITSEAITSGTWSWDKIIIGVITLLSGMLISLLCKGKMKLIPIFAAIVIGFIFSLIISSWDKNIIDYSIFTKHAFEINTYIGIPKFSNVILIGQNTGFQTINSWSVWPFFLMMPIALVTIAEHIGDHTVLGKMTNKDYLKDPGLHRTLLGDGVATMFAGLIGGPANTSYGENTTVVAMSRVSSTYVTGLAAIFAILLSFLKVLTNILSIIPSPVLGGVEILLFGFITSNGLKILIQDKIDLNNLKNLFIISTMLIIGLGGAAFGFLLNGNAIMLKGMSIALIVGILLNSFLPDPKPIKKDIFKNFVNKKE